MPNSKRTHEPTSRKRAARYRTAKEQRAGVRSKLLAWFEEKFEEPWNPKWEFAFGPLNGPEVPDSRAEASARADEEARERYDALATAARDAARWLEASSPFVASPLINLLRREVPRLGFWTERAWASVDAPRRQEDERALREHREPATLALRAPSDAFPSVLHGLDRLVHAFDTVNVLQLPPPIGQMHSRFLTDSELAKISILCGYYPETLSAPLQITFGAVVASQAQHVKRCRARVGQLRTRDQKKAMGAAGERGPKQ